MKKSDFKQFDNKEVILKLNDGDELRAKVYFCDDEYDGIIVDVLSTTQPEHYKNPDAAYTIRVSDIVTVVEVSKSHS